MESLFSVGDKILCVDSSDSNGYLVEGKAYKVLEIGTCACGQSICSVTTVGIGVGISDGHWHQTRFIKPDTDKAMEDQIFEALKEDLKIKI